MELEGEVQGRQDQAQKIIDMPQRDQGTSTSEKSAIICFGGLHVWAGKAWSR